MQVAPEQGTFLTMLTRLIGAQRAVEVGTFTGYSSLCIARGLPTDGHLLCCDVSEEWTSIARQVLGEGRCRAIASSCASRPASTRSRRYPRTQSIDFAFIDADKPNYRNYYEALLAAHAAERRDRSSTTSCGAARCSTTDADDDNTKAIKAFNDMVAADDRVDVVMLPIADGLTLARKR